MSTSRGTKTHGYTLTDADGNAIQAPEKRADLWPIIAAARIGSATHLTQWSVGLDGRIHYRPRPTEETDMPTPSTSEQIALIFDALNDYEHARATKAQAFDRIRAVLDEEARRVAPRRAA